MKHGLRVRVALLCLVVAGSAVAGDFPIKFAPPPNPMLNMTSTDITQVTSIDYMGVSMDAPEGSSAGPFSLNAFTIGTGRMEKAWDNGGWAYGLSVPIIFGSQDMGGGDKVSIFGFGENFPINFFIDPMSKETDDNSMPIYFGLHFNLVDLIMSMSYGGYTSTMTSMALMYGFQAGIQLGLNMGDALKFIPYVDFSKELGGLVVVSSSYVSTSVSLPSMPIVATPGFDLLLRPLNLSLGGAYQTVKQADGPEQKTIMLHLRFVKRFKSICG